MRAWIELGLVRACRHGPGERTYRLSLSNSMMVAKYLAKCLRRENSASGGEIRNNHPGNGQRTGKNSKWPGTNRLHVDIKLAKYGGQTRAHSDTVANFIRNC